MFTSFELKGIAAVVLVIGLCIGLYAYDNHQQALGAARAIAQQAQQALAATQENLRESNRRTAAIEGTAHDADQAASAARADADAAHSAGDRLRVRLAAAERRRAAGNPSAAGASAATDSPGLVPYDVFEGVRAAGERIAAFADQSRIAGLACERSYGALKP